MHSTVLRFSRKCFSTFGVLKPFLFCLKLNYCGIDPAYRASPTSQCAALNCRNITISPAIPYLVSSPVGVEKVTVISKQSGGRSVIKGGRVPAHALLDFHSRRAANH